MAIPTTPYNRYKIKAGQGQWFVIYDNGTVVHESGLSDIKKYLKKNSQYSDNKIQNILDKSLTEFVPINIRLTNESIKLRNILFEGKINKFYRALTEYIGDTVLFKPHGYYEAVDKKNNPVKPKYGLIGDFEESKIPETAASKYIGGCVLGSFSMNNSKNYYIYEINQVPDIDISHWSEGDFEYIEEVRYRKNVPANYIGKVQLNTFQFDALFNYYELLNSRINDEDADIDSKWYEFFDTERKDNFYELLKKIKIMSK